jgi:hypothetical protein
MKHCTINNSTLCISIDSTLLHFPAGQFSLSITPCIVRPLGRERTTELPNYLTYLKCASAQSVGKKFGQTGAPKTANELRRAELGQPTSTIHLPTPGHLKLGCAIELPAVRKEIPWC